MPYISELTRDYIDKHLRAVTDRVRTATLGVVTYAVYRLVYEWEQAQPGRGYATRAAAMAVLDSAKSEYYRREIAPYEDIKIQENGDIEPYESTDNRQWLCRCGNTNCQRGPNTSGEPAGAAGDSAGALRGAIRGGTE